MIQMRVGHKFDEIPYMPVIASSWSPKPWKYSKDTRPPYEFPTAEQWERELHRVAYDLHNVPQLGIPRSDGTRQKVFTIYAWNEFAEGGIVAPTEGEGYMKLEGIKKVFGVKDHPEKAIK